MNLIIKQGENQHPAPAPGPSPLATIGNPPPLPPAVTSLQNRFPTVDPIHFKDILENRFRPENLIKLSSTFIQGPRRQESITLGPYTIPTGERDGEATEYRGLTTITQPLGIYFQALLHFCPDGIERELGHALHLYTDLLHTINRSHTIESLRAFHFTFHRKRMALGLYDPAGWRERDSELQQMILVRRDPPSSVAGAKRPFERAFAKEVGGNPQATEVCRNWNEGRCHTPCRYKHACKICGAAHPASGHLNTGRTELASGSNSILVRPAASKQ